MKNMQTKTGVLQVWLFPCKTSGNEFSKFVVVIGGLSYIAKLLAST